MVLGLLALIGAPAAAAKLKRLTAINASEAQAVAAARSADGKLHLVYQIFGSHGFAGLQTIAISASGHPAAPVTVLSGVQAGQPGLVVLPNGVLETVFGALIGVNSSVWGMTSSNGGASWTPPASVRGGGPNESLADSSNITAAMSGATPVLTLPQAGNIVIQRGLGLGSPSFQLTNTADGATTDADLAVGAATGEVVVSWPSIATALADYLQAATPVLGPAEKVPGQFRNAIVIAGRDIGAGEFAAYTTDGSHVRLFEYGGKTVAVGHRKGTTAKRLAVATGKDGRVWVMWGDDSGGGIAVTRSNRAVTRFEPVQHLALDSAGLDRLSGDGRLGPLDLLVAQLPNFKGPVPPHALYYARVQPVLSASVSVKKHKSKKGKLLGFTLTVKVSDAGDAFKGAKVSIKGHHAKTSAKGVAKLALPASAKGKGKAKLRVSAAGYKSLVRKLTL